MNSKLIRNDSSLMQIMQNRLTKIIESKVQNEIQNTNEKKMIF